MKKMNKFAFAATTVLFASSALALELTSMMTVPLRTVSATWKLNMAKMQVDCSPVEAREMSDGSELVQRRAQIKVEMLDHKDNLQTFFLPAVMNITVAGGSADGTECKSSDEVFLDGLNGKSLRSIYGTYKATASGITSTSTDLGTAINENGVQILDTDSDLATNMWGNAKLTIQLITPDEATTIAVEGTDSLSKGSLGVQVAPLGSILGFQVGK